MTGRCTWFQEVDGQWATSCGESFEFTDDGPNENRFSYCCYCGGALTVVPYEEAKK